MGKFKDIYEKINEKAKLYAEYHYTSVKQFQNVTQETNSIKILFLLNSDNLKGTNTSEGPILDDFNFEFFVIKNHGLDASDIQIAEIQDECFLVMNKFIYAMNASDSGKKTYPITQWDWIMVKFETPNAFTGVKFNVKIKTACNL